MHTKSTQLLLVFVVMLLPTALFAQSQQKAIDDSKIETEMPEQLDELPPVSILKSLGTNIESIKPVMTENEVFETLGLIRYKEHLKSNSFIRMDGAGGNWRVLLDDHNGYSLAFRDFMGHGTAKCMIRTPNRPSWTSAKTSIPAITAQELQDDLNRQMKKARTILLRQNEIKKKTKPN